MDSIRLALVQMKSEPEPRANLNKAIQMVKEAALGGANVVCLQELFLTRYFCQTEDIAFFNFAEPIPGPTTEAFSEVARRYSMVVITPVFERRAAGIYHNSAVVIDADGSLVGRYRKMHIPDDPGYYEKFYFTPGDLGFGAYRTRYGVIGVLICWDQWFPEAARLVAMAGAQIIFYPTAIGWHRSEDPSEKSRQRAAWQTIQRAHAIANGSYVAVVNRVGIENEIEFWGSSFVADPMGQIVAEAGSDHEALLFAECHLSQIEKVRQHWPFWRDRRVDAYGDLMLRWRS